MSAFIHRFLRVYYLINFIFLLMTVYRIASEHPYASIHEEISLISEDGCHNVSEYPIDLYISKLKNGRHPHDSRLIKYISTYYTKSNISLFSVDVISITMNMYIFNLFYAQTIIISQMCNMTLLAIIFFRKKMLNTKYIFTYIFLGNDLFCIIKTVMFVSGIDSLMVYKYKNDDVNSGIIYSNSEMHIFSGIENFADHICSILKLSGSLNINADVYRRYDISTNPDIMNGMMYILYYCILSFVILIPRFWNTSIKLDVINTKEQTRSAI